MAINSVSRTVSELCANEWRWGTNDCLSLITAVTGLPRPLWANTDTEAEARGRCLERYDSEWEAVACYLNAGLDRVEHLNTPFKHGDVVMTPPDREWHVNHERLRVKPEHGVWAIGVLDESLSVVSYSKGHMITFSPIGARWRKANG